MTSTVLFLHGAWVDASCWDGFRAHFEARGYRCLTPAWPFDDRSVAELRASPSPELASIGVRDIVAHYAAIARGLSEPPILVGHSFGGLFVQKLLDAGIGAGGIAIDSAPPRGVMPSWNAVRASAPVLAKPFGWRRIARMSRAQFAWGFAHTLSASEQEAAYERHVIPTPGRPFFEIALAPVLSATRVDFAKTDRAPLLLIAGELDRTITADMNRTNHARYAAKDRVDLKVFPERTHWIIAQPGYEEVADYALSWIERRGLGVRSGERAVALTA